MFVLPKQSWTLHGICSVSAPSEEQYFPPNRALSHVRFRVLSPPPQDTEHEENGLHSDSLASSENIEAEKCHQMSFHDGRIIQCLNEGKFIISKIEHTPSELSLFLFK